MRPSLFPRGFVVLPLSRPNPQTRVILTSTTHKNQEQEHNLEQDQDSSSYIVLSLRSIMFLNDQEIQEGGKD